MVDQTDERIGTRLGKFRIDALVGIGGMGRVYSATAPDGTRVALKIVKDDFARDETFMRRFGLEARIAQTVRNPHVVRVLEAGESDGCSYLAEELIDGSSLEQRLRSVGRLDLATTVSVCAQVANGLDALWAAGMVHRDVKPGNILLGPQDRAYITDFGLAKDTQGALLTSPGESVGTLNYMSPEQIRGETVTAAADIYSLGCVVFECVQGRPPFGDRQGLRVIWGHLQEEPPDPTAGDSQLPAEFIAALKHALRKDPAERPASSSEYARSLARAAGISVASAEA